MSTHEDLKMHLTKVDAEIEGIKNELSKAMKVRASIFDRLFELETGFRIGDDALYSARHRQEKNVRVKIIRRTSVGQGTDWWCKIQIYKKDGTLGKNEAQVFSVKEELTHPED